MCMTEDEPQVANSETRAVGEKQDGGLGVSQDGCQKIQVSLADFYAAAAHHHQILQHVINWAFEFPQEI